MSGNPTHRTRLARALSDSAGIPYQKALSLVEKSAAAGLLPARLDADGMREALQALQGQAAGGTAAGSGTGNLEPRYYRLAEIAGGRLQPGVPQRIARAAAAGAAALRSWGDFDPQGPDEEDGIVTAGDGAGSDWQARVAAAGTRPDCILPDPYEGRRGSDGTVPLDRAMDRRDATGDLRRYTDDLESIVRREPRDVDAWAHLGNHYLNLADDPAGMHLAAGEQTVREWLQKALGYYQAGVGAGELALPDPFGGFLSGGQMDNRPFFRALHGMALSLWALGRFDEAEQALANMLWLNPQDRHGARYVLEAVRARAPWKDQYPGPAAPPGRITAWASAWGSQDRQQAIAAIRDRLLVPPLIPGQDGEGPLPRWQWLLGQFGNGVPLTQAGNLNRAFVLASADRFGWDTDFDDRPPRTEHDVTDLHELRVLATGLGLARKSGRKMILTPEGRRLAADPGALWQAAARGLVSVDDEFEACAGELFLVFLLHRGALPRRELGEILVRAVTEAGFREAEYGEPPSEDGTMWAAHRTINRCRALGLLAGGKWTDFTYRFTAAGAATAIEALRARAGLPAGQVKAEEPAASG